MLRIQMLASTLRQFDHEDLVATLPTIILARDHNGYKAKKLRDNLQVALPCRLSTLGFVPMTFWCIRFVSFVCSACQLCVQAHGFRNVATWEILDGSKFWGGRADPGWDQTRDLEPEQIAMRQTLRDALRAARASGVQRVLILEDHAVPHCNLKVALERLLLDRRCGMLPLGDPKVLRSLSSADLYRSPETYLPYVFLFCRIKKCRMRCMDAWEWSYWVPLNFSHGCTIRIYFPLSLTTSPACVTKQLM